MAFSGGTCLWHVGMVFPVMFVKRREAQENGDKAKEQHLDPTAIGESEQ